MSEREDDLRLDRELRGLLRDRDPGPAPYGLRGRVDRVPGEAPRRVASRTDAVGRALALAGTIAAAVAVVVVLVAVGRAREAGVVGGPSPMPVSGGTDPFGPGVVAYPPIEAFGYAAALLATGLLALGLGLLALRRRGARISIGLGFLVPVIVAALALMPGVVADEEHGGMVTPVKDAALPAGYQGPWMMYVIAGPDETYTEEFGIRNKGPLPMTVRGLVGRSASALLTPHWIDVRLIREPQAPSPAAGEPFEPFTLAPGAWIGLQAAGMPGPCAIGPAFDPAASDGVAFDAVTIYLSYDILGWPRADRLTTSYELLVPWRTDCDPTGAGAASATP